MQIFLQLSGLNIEHVDEDLDIPEDVIPLDAKSSSLKGLLTATTQKVEHSVAQEPHVAVLHVDGGPSLLVSRAIEFAR